ncbi:lipase family protein, putative [Ichthyophthirius multifiliis]|uniref:Lipase family protein, putative n=1 Tax=Ichthyophthirius multifiliis TaxID=5932 RepID=G0R3Y4_ICHMU|nr:lipase family protein, putative [Ichthyophthirius multifiliis]EGR27815.1 lipase family protein, putative [Ichthyophthirius multifiliis]|eukprot:XP_004027160.1 lipase family protein, putative [Ichthyophthirius multifiliis]
MFLYDEQISKDMAALSLVSYCQKQKIQDWNCANACNKFPYKLQDVFIFTNKTLESRGLIGYWQEKEAIVLSFRGTLPWLLKNWIEDLDVFKITYEECDNQCEIHRGFEQTFNVIKAQLIENFIFLKQKYPNSKIFITGHSLGGAMSNLAVPIIYRLNQNKPIDYFYNFGSPRVGDENYVEWFERIQQQYIINRARITHNADPVPHLPPNWYPFKFKHIGNEDTFEEKCGWMETMCGLGLMMGPLLGSLLIYLGGFITPFIFFTIAQALQEEIIVKEQQSSLSGSSQNSENEQIKDYVEISYKEIFRDRYLIFNYILILLPSCGLLFLDPTMGIYFNKVYGLDDLWVGLLFSVGTVTYLILSPLGTYMIKYVKNYSLLLFIGTFITGLSFIFLGPDPLLGIPSKLYITCIANVFIGVATLFIYIPALPQLYKILLRIQGKDIKNEQIIGDVASALYNTSYAIGEFIGPLLGGALSQLLTFQRSASVFGVAIIAFSLLYLFFGGVFEKLDNVDEELQNKIKQEILPLVLSPASRKCNSNLMTPRQVQLKANLLIGSPFQGGLQPLFYTPTLKSEEGKHNFVIKGKHGYKKHKHKKLQKVEELEYDFEVQFNEQNIDCKYDSLRNSKNNV